MEQPIEAQNQPQHQVQMPPVQPTAPASDASHNDAGRPIPPAQGPPPQKKSHAWIWILGGCLGILILAGIAMIALGWWGARKAKKELKKYQPNLEQMKENADKWNKESEEWQKKAQELQNNLPNPEEMPK